MSKETRAITNDMGQLAEDAHALVAATADVAGEKVRAARQRLAAVLERGKEVCGSVRDQVVEGAKTADEVVRENPYPTMAIALGIGAVIGYLVGRRDCSRGD
jgi:ElaB/YqjD/DUF883 family membrane-anchored ribosome-binding protein